MPNDALLAKIREFGKRCEWAEVYALCSQTELPFDDLLARCKASAHEMESTHHEQQAAMQGTNAENKASSTPSIFTDVLEAHIHSREGSPRIMDILSLTLSDPVLANHVGVRRLWRACRSVHETADAVNDAALKIFSRWIIHAASVDVRRNLVMVLMRTVASQESALLLATDPVGLAGGRRDDDGRRGGHKDRVDRKMTRDMSEQLMRALHRVLQEEGGDRHALGDAVLSLYHFWCQKGDQKRAVPLMRMCKEERLLKPENINIAFYTLAVTGALNRISVQPQVRADDEGESAAAAVGQVALPKEEGGFVAVSKGADKRWLPNFVHNKQLDGLESLLALASDNSVESLIIRQKFFHVIFAKLKPEERTLILYLATPLLRQQQGGGARPLLGTGVCNVIAVAQSSLGLLGQSLRLLDLVNAERTRPEALLVFKQAQESALPFKHLVSFGANVFTYIQIANSKASISKSIQQVKKAQWPSTMELLFRRMASDGVTPDMRFLFNVATAARELKDFNLVTAALEAAHLIARVPRVRVPSAVGTSESTESWAVPASPSASSSTPPPPPFFSSRDIETASRPPDRYIPTPADFSQIYHYAIETGYIVKRPEDCLLLLMAMVSQQLQPSGRSMFYVLRGLTDAGSAQMKTPWEEVTRLFGLMPKWGVKRDNSHTACFVEALAGLGRVGDAFLSLSHMEKSEKELSPYAYAVVLKATITELTANHPKNNAALRRRGDAAAAAVGGGKHVWTEQEAVAACADIILRIVRMKIAHDARPQYEHDYLLGTAYARATKAVGIMCRDADPAFSRGLCAVVRGKDPDLAAKFFEGLSHKDQMLIRERS